MTEFNKKDNPLKDKSENLADRVMKLYKYLVDVKKENIISKQIMRSGTSVGANISEAQFASSRKDFIQKLKISEKELSETIFWINRLRNSEHINQKSYDSLIHDCNEVRALLSSSIITSKRNACVNEDMSVA